MSAFSIGAVRAAVSKALSKIEDGLAREPSSFVGTPYWVQAPAELQEIVSDSDAPYGGAGTASAFKWLRSRYDGVCGQLNLNAGLVVCGPSGRAGIYGDTHARKVRVADSTLRPIHANKNRGVFAQLLRTGDVSTLIRGPSAGGRAVLLGAHYDDCNNYFHFWVDAICDLWFVERLGIQRAEISHFVMPFSGAAWQREILGLCGIPVDRVVPLSSFSVKKFAQLVIPIRAKGGRTNPTWLVRAAREISGFEFPTGANSYDEKIYVSRQDTTVRRLVNESEVISFLVARGYRVVSCSGLTVREQQRAFARASVIVAPHGAALTNLLWCRPGTRVVEFLPVEHANACFHDISALAKLEYSFLTSHRVDMNAGPRDGSVMISMEDLSALP